MSNPDSDTVDEDSEHISCINYRVTHEMYHGNFTVSIKESASVMDEARTLDVTLLNNSGNEVGSIIAYVIPRDLKLYDICETLDVHDVGELFFTESGRIRSDRIEGVNDDEVEELGILLYIYEVKISPKYRGNSLSLIMINKLLDHLDKRWTVAFLTPFTLKTEPGADLYQGHLALARHYARLGFRQASNCPTNWEIPNSGNYSGNQLMLYGFPGYPRSSSSNFWYLVPSSRTNKTKAEVRDVNVFVTNASYNHLNKLACDLKKNPLVICVLNADKKAIDEQLQNLSNLVEGGEDINRSEAVFFASFYGYIVLISKMIELGANVNQRNDELETLLHVAARNLQLDTCKVLLQLEADKELKNKGGMRTFDYAVIINNDISIHAGKSGTCEIQEWNTLRRLASRNVVSKADQLEVMYLLMVDPTVLVGGVLPSKMFHRLEAVAEVAGDECRNFMPDFQKRVAMDTDDAQCEIELLYSVPTRELPAGGIYKSYAMGWQQQLQAIGGVMSSGNLPTQSAIQAQLRTVDRRYQRYYTGQGGSLKHGLMAVITEARRTSKSEGDGGFEDSHLDILEKYPDLDLNYTFVMDVFVPYYH